MGESSFVCTFCSKEFANKSRLEVHLKVHTGEKTHVCSQCNRAFRTASDLKVHFRTHTGEKPYKCKFCDQAFAVSRNLTAHTRIHTGERPFVCSLCGKAFTQKSALNVHMRIHTGDKPFQCIFCAKQFAYSNSLKMHLKEHTRGSPNSSSQNISTTVSTTPVTPTTPTTTPSRLVGRKRGRGGRRGGRGNRRKREPFKQDTVLGFSDYTQPEEEHLYTCSICSQGFDQIEVLAEHWKSHNEESDSEKSDEDSESLSSDMQTAESFAAHGTIKAEAGTSEGSRNNADSNQTPSIYNNLREIIAKSLGVTQISNGQRHLRTNNHDHSAVTFGSAAKLYQSPSLLRGYQTSKSSSDRIFGRLKHPSLISDQDEMLESPTFQSPLNAESTRVNNENIFGSLASITEKAKDNQDNTDVGFFSPTSLSGSFYVGNNAPDKKPLFPDQSDSAAWEDYPNNCTGFNTSEDKNATLEEQMSEKPTINDNAAYSSLDDSKGFDNIPIKREGSKSSCLIDSKLDIASLFDQDIYTSALNDALKSLPSTTSTSFLTNNNIENTDPLLPTSADVSNSQPLQESQELENSPPSFMPPASTMMASSSMPSIMSMMDNSQLDLLTDTSTPTVAAVTAPSNDVPSMVHTHKCNLCGMVFCDSALFSEHLDKHSKSPNPFMCTECGKQCSRQYDLKVHARTHTGERPYKCKFCNRGFAISRNLVAHLRIHTGERPYKCETCNKSFTQQSALRTHSRIHTGEKPYLCKACGKQFAYSYVLNSHLRNSKLYRCDYCEGMYIGACTMAQHMKSHEDENGKLDPVLLEKKPVIDGQLAEPTNTDASRNQAPPTNAKPKRSSKRKSAVSKGRGKSNNLLSDLCSEFQDQPMPNLDYSDILQEFQPSISKFDDRIAGFETKEDNSAKASNFLPFQTLPSKSESILDQFSQEGYDAQFAEYGEELDKIVVDSLNTASGTLQNPEQSLANSSNQDGGFGGKLSSYFKYAKHLSQRHHAMISRKVKARPQAYICWLCRQGFGLFKNLSKHMVQHWKKNRKYSCRHCFMRFTKQRASIVHQIIHESKKRFKCDLCSKGFVFACNLISHQKLNHSLQYRLKPFKCQHCLQAFGRYYLLSTHLKLSHPEVSPRISFQNSSVDPKFLIPPSETDYSFSSNKTHLTSVSKVEENLVPEYQREHSAKEADFKDPETPLTMKPVKRRRVGRKKDNNHIVVYLKDEVETDSKRKKQLPTDLADPTGMITGNASNGSGCNFSCTFCDRSFNQRHQLIVHLRIHTGEKPYKCTWCQKAFRVSNDLNVHTRIHTGYRPYHCKICDKTFTVLRNLSTHMRVHTGERPFQCNICAKRFSQKSALTVHQRIHTGSKPFKCELCPQSFAHSSSLRQHKQRHQNNQFGEKEFWCTICRQAFTDYSELVVHLEEHSNNPQGSDNLAVGCSNPSQAAASSSSDYISPVKSEYSYQNAGVSDGDQSDVRGDGALNIKADPDAINIMESLKFKALTDEDDDDDKGQSTQSATPTLSNENMKKTTRASGSRRKKCKVSQVLSPESMMYPPSDVSLNVSGSDYGESFHQEEKFQPTMENDNVIPVSYSCDDCGKVFSRKCHLQTHSRIHAGEKLYKCEVCQQGFSNSRNLTAHMKMHTGERPFKCQLCNQTFAYSHSLNTHCKQQHNTTRGAGKGQGQSVAGKVFKCAECDQTFAHASMLSVHRRIHKPQNQNRGRRRRVTSEVLLSHGQTSEECLSLSYDENKLRELAEVQADLNLFNSDQGNPAGEASEEVSPENGLNIYQSQRMRFGITDRMNLRSKQPKRSRSTPNKPGKDVPVEEYSKVKLEAVNASDQQNPLEPQESGNVSSLGSESVCNVCGKSFSQRAHLNAHYRIHTGERPYRCRSCPKAFRVRSDLTVHVRTHTGERPYKCRFCPKAFSISRNLTAHLRTHTGERPFPCQHCTKRFTQKSALTVHLRTHTGVRPYVCMQCGDNFAYSHSLKVHMKNHDKSNSLNQSSNATGSRSRRNNCNATPNKLLGNYLQNPPDENINRSKGKQTSRRNGARNATPSVKQEPPPPSSPVTSGSDNSRPYSCQVCGKSFMQNSQLVAHVRIHSGERPYLCRWCPKTFRLSSDLTVHQRVHTGEKPYKCEQCDKTFSISRNLITHMRTHTGERPFQCSCCSKRFTQKSALTVHMRTHTGATPYTCDVCLETFAYSSCLSLHRKHKKAIDCNQCGEVLLGKCAFRSHMQTHETDKTFLKME